LKSNGNKASQGQGSTEKVKHARIKNSVN
jgi:hypothetical protein